MKQTEQEKYYAAKNKWRKQVWTALNCTALGIIIGIVVVGVVVLLSMLFTVLGLKFLGIDSTKLRQHLDAQCTTPAIVWSDSSEIRVGTNWYVTNRME